MYLSRKVPCFLSRCYSSQVLPVPLKVIKVPKYVEKHVENKKFKEYVKELNRKKRMKILHRGNTSIPVISSTNGDYNFYLGQLYNEHYKLPLISEYWYKTKTSGQKFTLHPYEPNPSLPSNDPHEYVDDEYLPNDFSKMDLNQAIVDSLRNDFNFGKPLRVQTLAIPRILSNRHVLIATEAGSGKTISYLAPFIHKIAALKQTEPVYPDSPKCIVVTPGRELAEQIAVVAHKLGESCGVSAKVLIPDGTKLRQLIYPPKTKVDLLVATMGILIKLLKKGKIGLGNVRYLVFDEADTLLDQSFMECTQYLLSRMLIRTNLAPDGAQMVFASSIYPSNLHELFNDEITQADVLKICSPYLHRVPTHIQQKFIRVSNDSRSGELLELVKRDYNQKKQVMIFCNHSDTCDWMVKFLSENGVPSEKFHKGLDPVMRSKVIYEFKRGNISVLCCTDLASRGLDTQNVKHVINFDVPNNISDYLLRAGRVGRAGSNQGTVTNLCVSQSGMYTVQDIERTVKNCVRLPNVDSDIKKKIKKIHYTF